MQKTMAPEQVVQKETEFKSAVQRFLGIISRALGTAGFSLGSRAVALKQVVERALVWVEREPGKSNPGRLNYLATELASASRMIENGIKAFLVEFPKIKKEFDMMRQLLEKELDRAEKILSFEVPDKILDVSENLNLLSLKCYREEVVTTKMLRDGAKSATIAVNTLRHAMTGFFLSEQASKGAYEVVVSLRESSYFEPHSRGVSDAMNMFRGAVARKGDLGLLYSRYSTLFEAIETARSDIAAKTVKEVLTPAPSKRRKVRRYVAKGALPIAKKEKKGQSKKKGGKARKAA